MIFVHKEDSQIVFQADESVVGAVPLVNIELALSVLMVKAKRA